MARRSRNKKHKDIPEAELRKCARAYAEFSPAELEAKRQRTIRMCIEEMGFTEEEARVTADIVISSYTDKSDH